MIWIKKIQLFLLIFLLHCSTVSVAHAETDKTTDTPNPVEKQANKYETMDSFFLLYQPYIDNIGAYNPIFFLVGADPKESLFQLSFKYNFFKQDDPLASGRKWLSHIYYGYTQTSFWDLESDSKPFEATSYKPELFYVTSNFRQSNGLWKGLFIQSGYRHESNGQSGDVSRSTNYAYIRPVMVFYHEASGYGLQIAPEVWAYVNNNNSTNPDLEDYRGYFDLEIKFGKADSLVAETHLWAATEGTSFQVDVTYPLNRHIRTNLNFYLQLHYANRLGESLLDYRERTNVFRFGIAFVR